MAGHRTVLHYAAMTLLPMCTMLKILLIGVAVSVLSLLAIAQVSGPLTASDQPTEARKVLLVWMNTLLKKSETQVVAILGGTPTKSDWEFNGKKEVKLQHKLDDNSSLDVYFFDGKVIKLSILILSD